MEQRDYWYLLGVTEGFGAVTVKRLMSLYGSPDVICTTETLPISSRQQEALRKNLREAERLLGERDALEKKGIRWCCQGDPHYPERLRMIPDPPVLLYYRGELPSEEKRTAGIIGARRCSAYGRSMAEYFGRELAKAGLQVISGMAMGVDGYAQSAALAAGGRSFGILGCGVDIAYPMVNRPLYERLQEQGGVLSEFTPGTPPLPQHFPLRNRIISGLSDVLLVIEARKVSGTLITVDQALEQGKDVLALPGRVGDPLSEGCNHLIRQGAGILTGTDEVLQLLGMQADPDGTSALKGAEAAPADRLSEQEKKVLGLLSHDPMHLEELMKRTGLGLGTLSLILLSLEERGLVKPVSGNQYIRVF